jgi:F-type H+-transporting ATPase subunit a
VNHFWKTILILVTATVLGAGLHAESAVGAAANVEQVAAEAGRVVEADAQKLAAAADKPLVTSYAPTLLFFGPVPTDAPVEERHLPTVFASIWPKQFPSIPITNSILYTWVVALVILAVVRIGTRNMKEVPSGVQNFVEALVGGLRSMCEGMLEPKVARWVFPLAAAYFIFIAVSNLMGLLPGIGSIGWGEADHGKWSFMPFAIHHAESPLFRPPTADANMTVAMSAIFFVMNLWWALKYNGPWGLVKHIFGVKGGFKGLVVIPLSVIFLFVGCIEMISLCVRPVALSMRLYGNIFGGESVLAIMLTNSPLGIAALPFYFLEILVALVQALVFTMLTIAFTSMFCSHTEEDAVEHGH